MSRYERNEFRDEHLVAVSSSCEVSMDGQKSGTVVPTVRTPHHATSAPESVDFLYTTLGIPFTTSSPDSMPPVRESEGKPGFIAKDVSIPVSWSIGGDVDETASILAHDMDVENGDWQPATDFEWSVRTVDL
jgi:hypothetical protein